MTFDSHANLVYGSIAVVPDPALSGTQITLNATPAVQFAIPPFNMLAWPANEVPTQANSEIVRVTAIGGAGDLTLTIERAQEGSTAIAFSSGYLVAAGPTAKTFTDIESAITAEIARAENEETTLAAAIVAAQAAAEAASVPASAVGADSGVASLDSGGHLPVGQLPSSVVSASPLSGQHLVYNSSSYSGVNAETINPMDPAYGAAGNMVALTDAAITASEYTLTSVSTAFVAGDVGKWVVVQNAIATGVPLVSTIASVASGVATLNDAAYATVSGASMVYATDDTAAIQAAVNAANARYIATGVPQCVLIPNQAFLINPLEGSVLAFLNTYDAYTAIQLKSGVYLRGNGRARISIVPPPVTITTSAVTLPATSIPVVSTKRFGGYAGFGYQMTIGATTYGFSASPGPTSFTGTFSGSGTIAPGTPVLQRVYTSAIATDGTSGVSSQQVGVRGLTIDGQAPTPQTEYGNGLVQIGNTSSFDIAENLIENAPSKAIDIAPYGYTPAGFWIRDNEITNCAGNAVALDNPGTDFFVVDNRIHDIANSATSGAESLIGFAGCARGIISRNIVRNWGTVDTQGTDMQYVDNYLQGSAGATGPVMGIGTGVRCIIARNTVDCSNAPSAQGIYGASAAMTDSEISSNRLIAPDAAAYYLMRILGFSGIVKGNTFTSPAGATNYQAEVSGVDIVFADNRLEGLSGGGPIILATGSATVTGNVVQGAGMTVEAAAGGTVSANTINSGPNTCLVVQNSARVAVSGNSLSVTPTGSQYGTSLASCTYCAVSGNALASLGTGGGGWLPFSESSSDYNLYSHNTLSAPNGAVIFSSVHRGGLGTHSVCTYNYQELYDTPLDAPSSQPAVPASGTAYTNYLGTNCTAYVTGGTVTGIAINGEATGLTSGSFALKVGHSITLTYSVAPTWYWIGS